MLREKRGWHALYGITALGIALHIAGDVITSYGTMVLWPLSDWRAAISTTFIIDLWFSGIILAGLLFSALFRKHKSPALIAFAALCGYVAFQYAQRQTALEFARDYARSKGLAGVRIEAHPRPPTPFNWTVFVSDEATHRLSNINLVRAEPKRYRPGDGFIARIDSPYLPLDQAVWTARSRYGDTDQAVVREAWQSQPLGFFRWFAELPAFDGVSEGGACMWFTDLRFLTPGRDGTSFPFGACREAPNAPWRAYERTGPQSRVLVR